MVSNPETVASHYLRYDGEMIVDDEGTRFDSARYSRMKYGDTDATMHFGHEIAHTVAKVLPEVIEDERPPEFLVAYKAVPPACYYLSRYCLDMVNDWRLDYGNEPGRVVHVYKNRVAATNYATASEAERTKELESIGFSLEGRSMDDKNVVVLDDIRITGGAERKMLKILADEKPARLVMGYVALFDAQQAAENPSVENDLNVSVIKGVNDLLPLIDADNFDLNIRTLKLILATDPAILEPFLQQIPERLLDIVLRGAIDTGGDFIQQYGQGYSLTRSIHQTRSK